MVSARPKRTTAQRLSSFADDDDDDDEGEEGEEEESEEEEEGDMPLAPPSLEAILRGTAGAKRAAPPPAAAPAAKAAKAAPAAPAAPAVRPTSTSTPDTKQAKRETAQPIWRKLPSGVETQEVRAGTSTATAAWGRKVKVQYRGTLLNGKQFDAGSISFKLGGGEVIPGWDHGIKGMRVGEKRKLRIPPKLAYGPRGSPPVIPPNATLIFDVELKQC